ncbi:MAG TPA: GNAT family protein [Actinoplanes sp.]|nr:GNAT family protein [Actinoplanes sp.]
MTTNLPTVLTVRPLTVADARVIAGWRYDGPWKVYDPRPGDAPMSDNPDYLAVAGAEGGPLVGFCCSGVEARVRGLAAEEGTLDVGVGMDPSMVGQGHGLRFVTAIIEHYRGTTGARRLRAVVQSWNERSLRLTRAAGFVPVGEHVAGDVTFTVVVSG